LEDGYGEIKHNERKEKKNYPMAKFTSPLSRRLVVIRVKWRKVGAQCITPYVHTAVFKRGKGGKKSEKDCAGRTPFRLSTGAPLLHQGGPKRKEKHVTLF